eukprot:gene6802-13774_t
MWDRDSPKDYDSTSIHVINGELNISSALNPLTSGNIDSGCIIRSLSPSNYDARIIGQQDMRFVVFKDRLLAFYHHAHDFPLSNEKNWTPFEYGNRIYMIHTFYPFRIVQILPSRLHISHINNSTLLRHMADTVSLSSSLETIWEWGTIRGGTPALLIGDKYLTFFHSSKNYYNIKSRADFKVYFMGALTFSARPPFQILQISPQPLVTNTSYSFNSKNKFIGSMAVVFPMSFIILKDDIIFTVGKNDNQGYIVHTYLEPLLHSLKNVSQITLGYSNWTNDKPVPHSFEFTCTQYFELDYCDKLLRKSHYHKGDHA